MVGPAPRSPLARLAAFDEIARSITSSLDLDVVLSRTASRRRVSA